MKTWAIAIVLGWSSLAAFGQGQVQFRNYVTTTSPPIDGRVYVNGGPLDGNCTCRAALIGGPMTGTPSSFFGRGTLKMMYYPGNTTLTWVGFRTGTVAPNLSGTVNVGTQAARVVPGVDWGQTALVQMVAWQGDYNDWDSAYSAFMRGEPDALIGFSNPLTLTLPPSPTSPSLTYLWGLQWFALGTLGPNPFHFRGLSGPPDVTVRAGGAAELCVSVDAYPGPTYQWFFRGSPVGTGASCYQIANAGRAEAGEYYAVVSHPSGDYTTRVATLTIVGPPIIQSQPQSQTAVAGSTAIFRVTANGDTPLSYQWYFNGTVLPATGSSLRLSALESQNAGAYTVVVTNVWGAVTSAPALLNVIAPVDMTRALGVVGTAQNGTALNLEAANPLSSGMNWEPLTEMVLTGTNTSQVYVDWPMMPPPDFQRLYRAWQTNGVSQPPTLSIHLVPGIVLSGAVGSSVRIDYINQVGPIDAWVRLATVALTNSSQLYFDTSVIGQPARLYRLVNGP